MNHHPNAWKVQYSWSAGGEKGILHTDYRGDDELVANRQGHKVLRPLVCIYCGVKGVG
ncbi:MAG: hypothetical protein KGI98_14870 [Euryarchaeota archaeon]|nr:hypothetical protein [Euryarchaeota archaeon]MDE1879450.1 hypothetical protein [Euryarchaeota archaeon]